MENVLVIGGLGFIGYHLTNTLINNSFRTTVSSRQRRDQSKYTYPILHLDLLKMSDQEILEKISPFEYIIFAGGYDDRHIPNTNAEEYFYQGNVAPCIKLASLSKQAKAKKLIILGSYFSHFNREYPNWKLSEKHPFILSRHLQLQESLEAADGHTKVSTIEIPYVFGSAPNQIPLWKPLINYISNWPIIFYTKGGTNIVDVSELANAITGVIKSRIYKENWLIGGVNLEWKEMVKLISKALDKPKPVVIIPNFIVKIFSLGLLLYFKITKKYPGLNPYYFVDLQTHKTFIDDKVNREILSYGHTDIKKVTCKTVHASL